MTSDQTKTQPAKDPDQLRAEIAEIRADLGDTVEALAAKADVKAQAQAKVRETVESTKVQLDSLKTKAAERTEVGRVKVQASAQRGKETLSRYAPWPQVAAGVAATVVALVIGGRKLRARRATPVRRRFGR